MNIERIIVVEDDADIRELISYNLGKEGYKVEAVANGAEGLQRAREEPPKMILLDLMLPDIDGLEVCRRLKRTAELAGVPVIMVTAKGEEPDIVAGLELGADDYITKPFSPRVLIARVKAVLRRPRGQSEESAEVLRVHNIEIHPGRYEAYVDDNPTNVTVTEFKVLHVLMRQPGWVLTRYQIADAVHGEAYVVNDRSIDVQIAGLRKKLGAAGEYIETVRGVGYRFKQD